MIKHNKYPCKLKILGIIYSVSYFDKPSDVDLYGRDSLWGQIDFWSRSIRIYKKDRPNEDIWQSLMHEVLHGIISQLHITQISKDSDYEKINDLLATGLSSFLFDNELLAKDFAGNCTKL